MHAVCSALCILTLVDCYCLNMIYDQHIFRVQIKIKRDTVRKMVFGEDNHSFIIFHESHHYSAAKVAGTHMLKTN